MTHPRATTRARKIAYINSFRQGEVREAIEALLRRKRMTLVDLLSDEDADVIASRLAADAQYSTRLTIRNRAALRAE